MKSYQPRGVASREYSTVSGVLALDGAEHFPTEREKLLAAIRRKPVLIAPTQAIANRIERLDRSARIIVATNSAEALDLIKPAAKVETISLLIETKNDLATFAVAISRWRAEETEIFEITGRWRAWAAVGDTDAIVEALSTGRFVELPTAANDIEPKATSTAETRCLADVQAEPIAWLWPKRLGLGKVNIVAGQPGLGKSQITIEFAARVSIGAKWPDGAPCPHGSVIFISCEDDAGDTIVPRLDAAGADRSKVHILDWIIENGANGLRRRSFDIGRDAERIRDLCSDLGDVRLIIIDPISAYLGGTDSHKTADVRAVLLPLQIIAAEVGAGVLLVSHLNKGSSDTSAMSRIAGSGAFVAAARSAWIVGKHPQDDTARVFVPLKNNIGDDKTGFAYRILGSTLASGIETSHAVFDSSPLQIAAEDVLSFTPEKAGASDGSAAQEAEDFLRGELAGGKPVAVKDIKQRVKDAGLSLRTIERAKVSLGVQAKKANGVGGVWSWNLPASRVEHRQDRQDGRPLDDGDAGGLMQIDQDRHDDPYKNDGGVGGIGGVADRSRDTSVHKAEGR